MSAKEIDLSDNFENMGARMFREVASKTSDMAGDVTTTATLLARAIYREGKKWCQSASIPWISSRESTKVVRFALQNAASVAGLMITTEAAITENPQKKSKAPAMTDMDEDIY